MSLKTIKTTQSLSPDKKFKYLIFLCWLYLCEIAEPFTSRLPAPLSVKTLRLITSFLALVSMSIVVAKESLFMGTLLALLYSSLFATYALYSMLRLRLTRRRAYWVGE